MCEDNLAGRNALADIQSTNLLKLWLDWFQSGEPRFTAPMDKTIDHFGFDPKREVNGWQGH